MLRHIDKVLSLMERAHHYGLVAVSDLFAMEKRRRNFSKNIPDFVDVKTELKQGICNILRDAGLDANTITDTVEVRGGKQKLGRYLKAKLQLNDELIMRVVNAVRSRTVRVELSRSFLDILGCSDEGYATTFRSCYAPDGGHSDMPAVFAMRRDSLVAVIRNSHGLIVWRALCIYDGRYLYMSKSYADGSVHLDRRAILTALGMPAMDCTTPNLNTKGWVDVDWVGYSSSQPENRKRSRPQARIAKRGTTVDVTITFAGGVYNGTLHVGKRGCLVCCKALNYRKWFEGLSVHRRRLLRHRDGDYVICKG